MTDNSVLTYVEKRCWYHDGPDHGRDKRLLRLRLLCRSVGSGFCLSEKEDRQKKKNDRIKSEEKKDNILYGPSTDMSRIYNFRMACLLKTGSLNAMFEKENRAKIIMLNDTIYIYNV